MTAHKPTCASRCSLLISGRPPRCANGHSRHACDCGASSPEPVAPQWRCRCPPNPGGADASLNDPRSSRCGLCGMQRPKPVASEPLYVVKHANCDLWIAERAGSMARWGKRDEAMVMTRAQWDAELSQDKRLLVFEPVAAEAPKTHVPGCPQHEDVVTQEFRTDCACPKVRAAEVPEGGGARLRHWELCEHDMRRIDCPQCASPAASAGESPKRAEGPEHNGRALIEGVRAMGGSGGTLVLFHYEALQAMAEGLVSEVSRLETKLAEAQKGYQSARYFEREANLRVSATRKKMAGYRLDRMRTRRELKEAKAELERLYIELAESRAQQRAMFETMQGIKDQRAEIERLRARWVAIADYLMHAAPDGVYERVKKLLEAK